MNNKAVLVLEDGTLFQGRSIGVSGLAVGEVVFNTSMTGYQEILTDPSYTRQIVALTYPHVGNVGTNITDQESCRVQVQGLVVRNAFQFASNFRSQETLHHYLKRHQIVAIAELDTRKLTRLLRQQGAQRGCIMAGDATNVAWALAQVRAFPGLNGLDLAKMVSTREQYTWTQGSPALSIGGETAQSTMTSPYHVVVYDFGVKYSILRLLVDRGCYLTVVPAETSAEAVLALHPTGVFLSNGPGDPAACHYAIQAIQTLLLTEVPLFGICLGYQLLALACGAKTAKMKFGHHGSNHPVKETQRNRVMITTQNHGFAVDHTALPPALQATHWSLFDGTLQGIHHRTKPAFGFQGHPEAAPGPQDAMTLFDHFIDLMSTCRTITQATSCSHSTNTVS